jgi:hypothetical protein
LEYTRYRTLQDAEPRAVDTHFEQAAQQLKDRVKRKLPKPRKP